VLDFLDRLHVLRVHQISEDGNYLVGNFQLVRLPLHGRLLGWLRFCPEHYRDLHGGDPPLRPVQPQTLYLVYVFLRGWHPLVPEYPFCELPVNLQFGAHGFPRGFHLHERLLLR